MKDNYAITIQKKALLAIYITSKESFRARNITSEREGYFIMITGLIHQEDIINLNVH